MTRLKLFVEPSQKEPTSFTEDSRRGIEIVSCYEPMEPVFIKIIRPNAHTNCWYDGRVGQKFKLVAFHEGAPNQYEVDVSHLYRRGETTERTAWIEEPDAIPLRPMAYPPESFIDYLETEQMAQIVADLERFGCDGAKFYEAMKKDLALSLSMDEAVERIEDIEEGPMPTLPRRFSVDPDLN